MFFLFFKVILFACMTVQRRELKQCLKRIDENSLRTLCLRAMLTEPETEILARNFSRLQDEQFIADKYNMSLACLQRKKKIAIGKLMFFLRLYDNKTHIKETEIRDKIDAILN